MSRNGTLDYVILTTEADGSQRRDSWLSQWGKPTVQKVRSLIAKRSVKPARVRIVEANPHLANPATVVDITL